MSIYVLVAWQSFTDVNPAILTFTNVKEAKEFAAFYRDRLQFQKVMIRRDYKGTMSFIQF